MGIGDLVIAFVMLAGGIAGGFAFARRQRSAPPATTEVDETGIERAHLYGERFQLLNQWQNALSTFQDHLAKAYSVEEMATMLATAIQREFIDANILIAIGPVKDILLIQSMASLDAHAVDLDSSSCIISHPEIEEGLRRELALALYEGAKKYGVSHKRWHLLRDVQPDLQNQLGHRFHFEGQGIVSPLTSGNVLCGVMLITSAQFGKSKETSMDHGRFAALASELMATWVRCMAPQLLAGTAANPIDVLPIHTLASLTLLEHTATMVQENAESHEILDALVDYAHSINSQAAEISLLASQTCLAIRKICNADFAAFFTPVSPETSTAFALEALEAGSWTWSRYLGFRGSGGHPEWDAPYLTRWPDRFISTVSAQGVITQYSKTDEILRDAKALASYLEIGSLVVIPAQIRNHCAAMLVVGRKQPGGMSDISIKVSASVAMLASMSLATMQLMHREHDLEQSLRNAWQIAGTITKQSLATLTGIVQKHDLLIVSNHQKVAQCAEAIAMQMHTTPADLSQLRIAAMLCDLGMILIPSHILRKEGGLTSEELRLIQSHPEISVALLEKHEIAKQALPLILHHHERYDGTGYPKQLGKSEIPFGARILAVADTFVHLQLERPYRPAMSLTNTMTLIRQQAGKQFDPTVVHALAKVVAQVQQNPQAA